MQALLCHSTSGAVRPRQGRGSMEGDQGRSCVPGSGWGPEGVSTVAAGAGLQLHLICPWQWERLCGWNAEQHRGEGAGRWLPSQPHAVPLLQLRPRAIAWGRESREFISGPWKRRKERVENGNLGGGCAVAPVFSLRRGLELGGQAIGDMNPCGGPQECPPRTLEWRQKFPRGEME